ncbi:MAG: antibiotic biosynthesis monooxygenase [Deltaproteobacteria bacterium]|nr:antibiotic biosynthesis monooxygenase [Deltaproteobacteria bacterium]
MSPNLVIDLAANPDVRVRVDAFSVPEAARAELEVAMHRSAAFLATLPGYRGHVAFERVGGPSRFDIVTVAAWESAEAAEAAGVRVRAYYEGIGFDVREALERWGVTAERGDYRAPASLQ